MTSTWQVACESAEWIGPITATVTSRATGQPTPDPIQVALLPRGQRPVEADWKALTPDPDGTAALGVPCLPTPYPRFEGIWIRAVGVSEKPVLVPDEVGWLQRV